MLNEVDVYSDTEMLNWLIQHSAQVCWDIDGECCWVMWGDLDGTEYTTKIFEFEKGSLSRLAISAAMNGEYKER